MNRLGTKLKCATCNSEAVVIKPGDGEVMCHGAPMAVVAGAVKARDAGVRGGSGETSPDDRN
jgi:uncharacterized Zn-binding protein involved in type VI secretion